MYFAACRVRGVAIPHESIATPLDTAMRALQRIHFMKQVQLLEQLDEQGLRMLLNALPAWVKVRRRRCQVTLSTPLTVFRL